MLEEGYHIAGADRRELGFAVAEPMVEEPVGKAPGMIDRAGTDPALPNQILFIIDAQGCTGDLPRCRDRKSVVSGKSVSVRVDLGGRRIINKKKIKQPTNTTKTQ